MRNKSGIEIRKRILEKFDILNIWDFGDTKIFKAAVLPCVLILRKKNLQKNKISHQTKFTTIYSLQNAKNDTKFLIECKTPVEAILENGNIKVGNDFFHVQNGILKYETLDDIWQLSTTTNDDWLSVVKNHIWHYFGDVAKTKVGIKTTADSVFISDKWDDLEQKPELLRPLTTHKVARQFKSLASGKTQVLYTHTKENNKKVPIDIDRYPISKKYLLEHYDNLSSRKYIQEANRKWFEIWVSHDPEVWERPKIIFRDISREPTFWFDLDGTVVNGDCYWISLRDGFDISTLWLILAIGNSKFIEEYYDHCFNNKMYAGRRRFMTQYVEKFPLPNPELPQAKEIIELSKKLYKAVEKEDVQLMKEELNKKVYAIFGL